jgi:hypothetical protein
MADELMTPQALLRRLYHCELPGAERPWAAAAAGPEGPRPHRKPRFGPDGLNTYTDDTDTAPRTGSNAS